MAKNVSDRVKNAPRPLVPRKLQPRRDEVVAPQGGEIKPKA